MPATKKQPKTTKRQVVESAIQANCSNYNLSNSAIDAAIARGLRLYDMGLSNAMSISEAVRTARMVQVEINTLNRGELRLMRG